MDTKKTYAAVGIRLPDSSIDSIQVYNYCKPELTGVILLKGYHDKFKIWQMIQLGNLINIGWNIGEKIEGFPEFTKERREELLMIQNRQCIAHYRDQERDWEEVQPRRYKSKSEWSLTYAEWHRYYFLPDAALSKGKGEWFYDSPGFTLDEETGAMVPNNGRLLRWEIDIEEVTKNMKKVLI